jgi:hypothetical protein
MEFSWADYCWASGWMMLVGLAWKKLRARPVRGEARERKAAGGKIHGCGGGK